MGSCREQKGPIVEPQVKIEAQARERLRTLRVVRSSGTGWLTISLKNDSLRRTFALPQSRLSGVFGIPPKVGEIREDRVGAGSAVGVFVDHRDAATKQPLHLIAEPRLCSPVGTSDAELTHELGERPA